jgi:uncharacterized LabA/DUF88 family protein
VAFVDGQNLFFAARDAFGYSYPNYDALALSRRICEDRGWELAGVRFYTGIPTQSDDARWHHFWVGKLRSMTWQGVHVYARPLRYRRRRLSLPDGTVHEYLSGEEKGIDVRIALDVIRLAHRDNFDVALVFSQDQDLSEVAGEVRTISQEQARWIKIACAYPVGPATVNRRGIEQTDWIWIDRAMYDACLDRRDYRRKPGPVPRE